MSLHERIAAVLGWESEDVKSHSLQSLRELVRPISAKLVEEITVAIAMGMVASGRIRHRKLQVW